MSFLVDAELRNAIEKTSPPLLTGLDANDPGRQVRGCAVDLRIGDIHIPGTKEGEVGSASWPRKDYSLKEGETAVVRTREVFALDCGHAAFCFPSAHVSLTGLLMTNPGHVDPGYAGHLHITVINMGKEPYALRREDVFLRATIVKLHQEAARPKTNPAAPNPASTNPIDQELLTRLSPDFMSFNSRATDAAKKEITATESRARMWQIIVPTFFTILASALTWLATESSFSKEFSIRLAILEKINAETRLITLEKGATMEDRLKKIEDRLDGKPGGK